MTRRQQPPIRSRRRLHDDECPPSGFGHRVMRFSPRPRCEYIVTDRKRSAAARWQRRQRECFPLLGTLIAETQPSIDDVMDKRVRSWIVTEQTNRDHRAAQWRKGRRDIAARDPKIRVALLTYWNGHRWLPGDPTYLLDMLHGFDRGRLVLLNGQVAPHRIVMPAGEAIAAFGSAKPVSGGWFDRRASKPMTPRPQLPSHLQTQLYNPTPEGENYGQQ